MGNASFSIYLMHLFIISVVYKLLQVTGLNTLVPIELTYFLLVAASIFFGVIISRIIEYPVMNWFRSMMESCKKGDNSR